MDGEPHELSMIGFSNRGARAPLVLLSLLRAGADSGVPPLFNSCHASSSAASSKLRTSGVRCFGISLRAMPHLPLEVASKQSRPVKPTVYAVLVTPASSAN